MTDLSIVEAYFLFATKEKGKLYGYDSTKIACLMMASLYELAQEGSISFAENRIYLSKCAPDSTYLKPLYDHLGDLDSFTYRDIFREYNSAIAEWHLNTYTSAIGSSLAAKGLVTKAKLGFFGGRTFFVPHTNSIPSVAAEFQVDLQFHSAPSTRDCLLWILLERSNCVPPQIEKTHAHELHEKVEMIYAQTEELKQLIAYLDQLLSLVKRNKLQFEYY